MQSEKFFVASQDNHKIFVRKWSPDTPTPAPRAVVHLLHGMAEHCSRYEPIAQRLVEQGYVVYAHDHRGHGHSVPQGGLLGHYANTNGWSLVLADVHKINDLIHRQYPGAPVILIGHSMGSFITQSYLVRHGRTVDAAVLSGPTLGTPMAIRSGRMLAQLEKLRIGAKGRSNLIDRVTFATYNRQISKHPRTDYDWLSRDESEVNQYIEDPLCGFLCTTQLWLDLVGAMDFLSRPANIRKIPGDLPMYLLAGELDPVSHDPEVHGVERLANHLRSNGIKSVTTRLYPECRHEIFNELNRDQVVDDLLGWLELQVPAQGEHSAAHSV